MIAIIIDFDDSFTFNIFSEISTLNYFKSVRVIHFSELEFCLKQKKSNLEKTLFVFGPGPGHPNEYLLQRNLISKILEEEHFRFFGICLGHQLLHQFLGYEIVPANNIIHGSQVNYQVDLKTSKALNLPKKICTQHYNSLAVKSGPKLLGNEYDSFEYNNEILISWSKKFLSYQFHPESVGTTCPNAFFEPLKAFLL